MSNQIRKNSILKSVGFSLMEIMVALGIAGAGTLGFMSIQKSQIQGEQKMKAQTDVNNLANIIGSAFINERNCSKSFESSNIDFRVGINTNPSTYEFIPFNDGHAQLGNFRKILDANNRPLINFDLANTNQRIFGGIYVDQIFYAQSGPFFQVKDDFYGPISIVIKYKLASKVVDGKELANKTAYYKELPYVLTVKANSSGRISSCSSAIDSSDGGSGVAAEVTLNLKVMCKGVGGTYDVSAGKCKLASTSVKPFHYSPPISGMYSNEYSPFMDSSNNLLADQVISAKNLKENIYRRLFYGKYVSLTGDRPFTSPYDQAMDPAIKGNILVQPGRLLSLNMNQTMDNTGNEDFVNFEFFKKFVSGNGVNGEFIYFGDEPGVRFVNTKCGKDSNNIPQYFAGLKYVGSQLVPDCRSLFTTAPCAVGEVAEIVNDGSTGLKVVCSAAPGGGSCEISSLVASNITSSSAVVTLSGAESASSFEISLYTQSGTLISSQTMGAGMTTYSFTALSPNTGYRVAAKPDCKSITTEVLFTTAHELGVACSTACDCPGSFDSCSHGTCVTNSSGSCSPNGLVVKGDSSCQWVCNGGGWTCSALGSACGAPSHDYQWCNDTVNMVCACKDMNTGESAPDISLCSLGSCMLQDCPGGGRVPVTPMPVVSYARCRSDSSVSYNIYSSDKEPLYSLLDNNKEFSSYTKVAVVDLVEAPGGGGGTFVPTLPPAEPTFPVGPVGPILDPIPYVCVNLTTRKIVNNSYCSGTNYIGEFDEPCTNVHAPLSPTTPGFEL